MNKSAFSPATVSANGGAGGYRSNPGSEGTIYWGQSQLPTTVIATQPGSGSISRNELASIQVEFLSPIDASSFSADDITLIGPNGPEPVTSVTTGDSRNFMVNLPTPLRAPGLYSLEIGPDIKGSTGLPMDQNENGVGGEATADRFTAIFQLEIPDLVVEKDLVISESDPSYRGKVIVVKSGSLTVEGSYEFKTVHLEPGTTLTGVKAQQASDPKATWRFESLIVEEGATIDVSGLGLPPTEDLGLNSSGSYAGIGATTAGGKTNRVFGSPFEPEDFGIGGRGNSADQLSFGGGALRLIIDELDLDGEIRANGGYGPTGEAAGASGGSIWIETDSIAGTGSISADGSQGFSGLNGGGGRVSLTYRETQGFDFEQQISAVGGQSATSGSGSIYVHRSDHSTSVRKIHLEPITAESDGWISVEFSEELDMSTFSPDDIQITNGSGERIPVVDYGKTGEHDYVLQTQHALPNGGYEIRIGPDISATSGVGMDQDKDGIIGEPEDDVFVFSFEIFVADQVVTETLEITPDDADFRNKQILVDGGTLKLNGDYEFESLRVAHGGQVVADRDPDTEGVSVGLKLSNELIVDEGASISLSGAGYGPVDGQPSYVGGSHGGLGGMPDKTEALPGYGDVQEPVTLGQGGRHPNVSSWSKGGGALKVEAVSTTVNGLIEAHGGRGSTNSSPGGAGGSIWLTTQALAVGESGQIGANGGYSRNRGAGGGGRVAVYYETHTGQPLDAALLATTGSASGAVQRGGAGTVYWQESNTGRSVLRIDNKGNRSGNWSEIATLPEGLDELYLIGGRVRLSVEAVPEVLVIDNAEVELTVPEIPSLIASNGSLVTLAADQVDYLELDGSTLNQASALVVDEQILANGSAWNQKGHDLAVTGRYEFQQSHFVQDGAWNRPEGNDSLTVSGYELTLFGSHVFDRLEIASGGTIKTRVYDDQVAQTGTLQLDVNELLVAEGGRLSVSDSGYGPADGQPSYVGGSHGGLGGKSGDVEPFPIYGDAREPVTLGRGGRHPNMSAWSRGGGALKVQAISATINGSIEAHGGQGAASTSPGGAGGSIWLTTQTLAIGETGKIGASGAYSRSRGAGGGGRVAIYYATSMTDSFASRVTANPGTGGIAGEPGSIVIEQKQSPTAVRDVSLNDVNGLALDGFDVWFSNEIDPASFTADDVSITGPHGAVVVTEVTRLDPVSYHVVLAQPLEDGGFRLSLGPDIQSSDGYGMDQDENGVPGEASDVFVFDFTVDTQPPSPVQLTSHQFGVSHELGARRISLSGVRNDYSSIWINGWKHVPLGTGPWQVSNLALDEGDNQLVFIAVDEANNHSASVGLDVNVDSLAPTKTGQSPSSHINESPGVVRVDASDGGSGLALGGTSITLQRDGVTIAGSLALEANSFVFTPAAQLLEGSYSVSSRLADQRGNVSGNFSGGFVLDYTAPGKPVLQPYPDTTSSGTYTFQGTKEPDTSLLLDGQVRDVALGSTTWSVTVELEQGDNTFTFQLRDQAGNISERVLATINFDDTAPGPVVPVVLEEGDGHTIKLDWSAYDVVANGNDIRHYRVYVQTPPFSEISGLTPYAYAPSGTRVLEVSELQRNTPVYVAVVAEDTSGLMLAQVPSAEVTPVDVVPPADVSQLTVTPSATALALRWLPVPDQDEDLAGYRVYIEKGDTTESQDLGAASLTMVDGRIAFDLAALEPATTYPLKVTSYDNDGNESEGATNPGVTLLANPSSVTAEPFSGKVELDWAPAQPGQLVKQYNVYTSTADFTSVSGMVPKASVAAGRLDASVAGLTNGTSYYFAVTAVNLSGGEDKQVTTVEATPTDDTEGPEITRVAYFDGSAEQELNDGDTVTRNGSIRVYAEDPSGLSRLEIAANGTGLGDDFTASPAFEVPWNLMDIEDGQYQLSGEVYDTLNNSTDVSLAVNVVLEPPAAPDITSPQSGVVTNQPDLSLKGQTVRNANVRVLINGVEQATLLAANIQGTFNGTITLVEGENLITVEAAYGNRGTHGAASTPVTVILDSTAPDAPQGLTATSKPLGQIALSWSSVENTRGYHIYRATSDFPGPQQATRITGQALSGTSYQDLPADDGTYFYRVVSVNDLGTESEPSPSASAVSDSAPPQALAIRYTPQGNHDAASGRTGPGRVDIEVTFNEALKTKPYLAFTVSGGMPMVAEIQRSYSDDKLYTGSFSIKDTSLSGTAMAVLSAHDEVGNRGTEVIEGSTLVVDTKGPEVANLQLNPSDPIKNDPDANGLGQEVEVVMTLADDVKPGELPTLVPFISDGATEQTIADYSNGITLTMDGSSQPGAPVYAGRFRLPLSAGQDESGEPAAEQIGFRYTARDDLGNEVDRISGDPRFQVYQGELPPLESPVGLTARALPGGKVELTWSAVEGAAGYKLYRQTPAESELSELTELNYPDEMAYIDGASIRLPDGRYQYAIASIRSQNGETSESAVSDPVDVNVDGTAPDAPENLSLELNGAGIVARWQPPSSEAQDGLLEYNLYRLDMPEGTAPGDLAGYTPLQNGIPDIIALDSRPSATEHLYVVTAVDPAGNESVPSNSEYLNVDLLPVSDLRISLEDQGRPVLFWNHAKASAVSFDVFEVTGTEARKLNGSLLDVRSFEDLDYNNGNPVSGAPEDRLYRVVAVDQNDVTSIGHELLLPALSVSLVGGGADAAIDRGVMNQVSFRVSNSGETNVVQARLKVTVMDDGTPRSHWSERFTVEPGGFTDVPVVIGGYDNLPTLAAMDLQILLEPKAGQRVTIQQQEEVVVGQSALIATLETEGFVRGATGKVRIALENPSEVETELLMATASGKKDSTEVRLVLRDEDGNTLSSQAIRQVTGDVVSLNNGDTIARIPANGSYRSQAFEVAVPSTATDKVRVHLEIDRFRYHTGRDTFVAIEGTRASSAVSLEETPYYGEISEVAPARLFVGETVSISGQALDRETSTALGNVPLTLVLTSRGFERTFPVYSGADGSFEHRFTPGASESGEYRVSILHPRMVERPEHGSFTVEGAGVTPTQARLTIPRNYDYGLDVRVRAGHATELQNVRLVHAPSTDAEGQPLPAPQGVVFDPGTARQIGANQSAYLKLKLRGDTTAADSGTLRFHIQADNRDQPLDTLTVEYFLTEAKPILLSVPSLVNTGVGLGSSQQENISLRNTGLETANNLQVSLVDENGQPAPDWFKLLTPANPGNLPVGEQADVRVAVSPDTNVQPGDYYFKIRVAGDNIPAIEVPVLVAATNSQTGDVFFHTTDIYTATLDENMEPIPGLGNVRIKLQNTQVLSEVFELTTDANGYGELTEIPAGRYSYRASAFDHESVSGHLWVKPGVTTQEQLFLMNKLINVEFSVTEITLEDRYDIVLKATYETNVPVPVVLFEPMSVNLPMLKKGEVFQGEFTITNHGLIEAYDVRTSLPNGDDFARFDYLVEVPDTIQPGQVVRVPYRIVALQDFVPSGDGDATGGGCLRRSYKAICTYSAECAVGTVIENAATMIWNAIGGSSCGGSGGGGGGGYFGGGGGGTNYTPAPPRQITVDDQFCPEDCVECCGNGSGGSGAGGFGGAGGGMPGGPVTGIPQMGGGL